MSDKTTKMLKGMASVAEFEKRFFPREFEEKVKEKTGPFYKLEFEVHKDTAKKREGS